jgi:hypothetical protein
MTLLSRSTVEPDLVTVQCDVCFPQFIATTTMSELIDLGWALRERGDAADMCVQCRFAPKQGQVPRVKRATEVRASGGNLPNFFVIGAAKAGTTSLHYYLDQHPHVYMSDPKELHYFCDPDCEKWESLYREHFPIDAKIRGEASTLYSRSPAIPGVPGRLKSLVPDAKLVYVVREPVERALASWREERFHVSDRRPIDVAFANPEDPHNPYVAASRYAEQLDAYLEHFSPEQLLVIDHRDLATDTAKTVRRVIEFLGLSDYDVDTTQRHNAGASKFEYGDLGHRLRMSAPAWALRKLPAPMAAALTAPARRLLRRPMPTADLPDDLMTRLRDVLRPDASRLRAMTGLDFADWSV